MPICRRCAQTFVVKPYREATALYCSRQCRSGKPEDRFWEKVNKNGEVPSCCPELGKCWLWIGTTNKKGYGRFVLKDRKLVVPHRFIYEVLYGKIPKNLQIDHLCRIRRCVNPQHLQAITGLENIRRGLPFRTIKTHCLRGHPLFGKNLYIGTGNRRVCRICHARKSVP
jgi:hypothetical protein